MSDAAPAPPFCAHSPAFLPSGRHVFEPGRGRLQSFVQAFVRVRCKGLSASETARPEGPGAAEHRLQSKEKDTPMNERTTETALFRFGIISPLLSSEPGQTLSDRLLELSKKTWVLPDGRECTYAASTIEGWLYRYRHGGVEALDDPPRRDRGTFPGMPEAVCDEALRLFRTHPTVRTGTVYVQMKKDGLITGGSPGRSTFYRWAAVNRPEAPSPPARQRRAFEAGWSAALWQADIMYGPRIARRQRNGRRRQSQTYLVAILDDHSRLLCEGRFFFSQSLETWLQVLRSACCRRGIPEKLYCDNGKVFTSAQIRRIGAVLGTQVIHTGVRDAAAKGKIERFFRTVRTAFLEGLELDGMPRTIEELNRKFRSWSETHYNRAQHSAIEQTPLERWIAGAHRLRTVDVDEASELFLFETERTVRKDGTFSLKARRFETDAALAGKRVLVRYEPVALDRVDVWFEGRCRGRAPELDLHGNDGLTRTGGQST